jgi:dihydrofolate synthase/folylpolyglutamate synthase
MAARVLEAAGFRTGLYTSPHHLRWKERISLAGDPMPEEILIEAMDEVLPLVDGKAPGDFPGAEMPTYFELTTLVGFCAFRLAGCERVVLETGLGGRLDSTNVASSAASLITPIELEHCEWLGDTIPQIAYEKAGIIKPGRPCYLSRQALEAREVFARVCAERGSELREAPVLAPVRDLAIGREGTRATILLAPGSRARAALGLEAIELSTPLIGAVQAENMALASLATVEVEPRVGAEALERGLAKAYLPARFELLGLDPPVVLDGAHTPSSVRYTLESFELLFPRPRALLFACARDKKHAEMAGILADRFDLVTVTRPGDFKQSHPEAVHASFEHFNPRARCEPDFEAAIRSARAQAAAAGMPLLVTGSFYLCAEAARILSVL